MYCKATVEELFFAFLQKWPSGCPSLAARHPPGYTLTLPLPSRTGGEHKMKQPTGQDKVNSLPISIDLDGEKHRQA